MSRSGAAGHVSHRILDDGGARSRKLWLGVFVMLLAVTAAFWVPEAAFAELCFLLLGVYGVFCGGNVAGKFAGAMAARRAPPAPEPPLYEGEEPVRPGE